MKHTFNPRVVAWFSLSAAVSLALAIAHYVALRQMSEQTALVGHTQEVLLALRSSTAVLDEAAVGVQNFVLTGEDRFLEPYVRLLPKIGPALQNVKVLTIDNAAQRRRVEELEALTHRRLDLARETIALRRTQGIAPITRLLLSGRVEPMKARIRAIIAKMEAEETALLARRIRRSSETALRTSVVFAVGMVANLVIIALAYRYASRQLRLLGGAEATLRRSESRFRGTFEAATVGMAMVAPDGKWLAVNPALCKTVGYSEAELLTSDFQTITHPDDLAIDLGQMRRLLAGESNSYRLEKRYLHKDGHLVHIMLSVSIVRDDAASPLYVVALIEDITARKRAEARLAAQHAVAMVLADSTTLEDATPRLLKAVGEALDVSAGEYWQYDPASGSLHASEEWWSSPRLDPAFRDASRRLSFARGEGLPGRVWERGKPIIFEDIAHAPSSGRTEAALAGGLRGAFGFPIIGRQDLIGVMTFLSHEVAGDDDALRTSLATLGRQIGLFVERRKAEEASRAIERRFRAIFDQTYAFIGLLTPDGTMLEANRAALDFAGITREEVIGRPFWDGPWWKDSAEARGRLTAAISSAARGEAIRFEAEHTDPHGQTMTVDFSIKPVIDEKGRVVMLLPEAHDITDRKRAEAALLETEERFRLLVEGVRDHAILMLDPHGRIVSWNAAAMAIKGYQAKEIIGRHFSAFSTEDQLETGSRDHELEIARTEGRWQGEGWRRRKNGSLFWANVLISPLKDKGGSLRGFAMVTRDATERRQAEEEMLKAKEAAEAASRAKSEFLANMSHEIRTPMNGILGMTGLALDTTLTSQQREYLSLVKSSADSLLTVINDILDYSKIEAGKLSLDPIPFSLHDSVQGPLKALALRAHEKGLELACRIAPDVPRALVGDAGRLRQVLVNLVDNAIKFTERGEVVVSTNVVNRHEGKVSLHFAVADTGIGIAASKLDAVFEPFEQADGSTTRKYGGTGLGLPISSKLVDLMGGRIWAESATGCGSTFHVTVTLAECDALTTLGVPMGAEALRGLQVIVADDHATNRKILEEFLTSWEMKPAIVPGGHAALVEMQRAAKAGEPYPLVVLDARMPDLDGFALVEVIRSDPGLAGAAILMLSSADLSGDAARSRELGVDLHLIKPITQEELLKALLTALGAVRAVAAQPVDRGATSRRLRVLLAEDNVVNQRLAVRLLERRGHEVTVAANGIAALAAFEAGVFDLILMDVHMPEMGGFEATALIREREAHTDRHIPIVAMTARVMKGDRERCLEAGMDGYVPKPVNEEELWQAIATAVSEPVIMTRAEAADPGTEPGLLDEAGILDRMGGDVGLLAELAGLFLTECPRLIDSVRSAVANGDPTALIQAAHALKGSLAYFGESGALDLARVLEEMGHARELNDSARVVAKLVDEVDRLGATLQRLATQVPVIPRSTRDPLLS